MLTSDNFNEIVKVGQTWRLRYNEGNRNNALLHIRAIVDEEYIVVRVWHNAQWKYRLETVSSFIASSQAGYLILENS